MRQKLTLAYFLQSYPNEASCLDEIRKFRWPAGIPCKRCAIVTPHHRIKSRPAYACDNCRTQTYPMAGTIFQKSTTPLLYWLYVIFVMTNSKSGVAAKQFQRELGVTYKTAWRMCKQVRKLMSDSGSLLQGIVEVDEAYFGGRGYWRGKEYDGPKNLCSDLRLN